MFCTNCGAKLPDNAKFCPNCGAVIAEHAAPVQEPVQTPVSAAAEVINAEAETVAAAQTAVEEAYSAAQEAVQAAESAITELEEIPAAEIAPEIIPELVLEPVPVPETPPVQPQESAPFAGYSQVQPEPPVQPEPAATQPPVPPYTAGTSMPAQNTGRSGGKKGKGLVAALLIVALLAGGFFLYWNLPSTRFNRYSKQASEAMLESDYETAADLFHKALEIRPDDQAASDALVSMYEEVQTRAVGNVMEGRFEDALNDVRLMQAILPVEEENNAYAMYDVYSSWITDEAEKGNFDTVQTLLTRADSDLTPEYADEVNTLAVNIRERFTIADALRSAAARILEYNKGEYNSGKDFKGVFGELVADLEYLKRYVELGGELPFAVLDTDDHGVMFYYDASRDAAQVYVGGITAGHVESGYADTFYMTGASTSGRSYEYFSAENWYAGRPGGKFREINFNGEPDVPSESNSTTVTGTLVDGRYDGEIQNNRNGKTYIMKFDNGKVQVLDTVDPNGDAGNVVGYTADKNSWITFQPSGLNGSYGVRYLT